MHLHASKYMLVGAIGCIALQVGEKRGEHDLAVVRMLIFFRMNKLHRTPKIGV